MKKRMKQLVALGISVIMALSMAACGSTPAPAPAPAPEEKPAETPAETPAEAPAEEEMNASISLWTYPVGKWGDSATVDTMLANFNAKYPGIEVTVEYLDYTNGDDQVNTAIEGGQAPDLVLEGPERLVTNWGAKGLMVDLSDLFATPAGGELYDSVKNACKAKDGNYYEYPLCMVAHCMAINKTMFEKANALQYLDLEKHTWTTENFFKAVQAVYDSGQKDVAAIYCSGQGGDQGTRAIINNLYSSTFTNADHTAYTANTPENIKALKELYAQQGIKFDASIAGGDEIDLFRKGQLAMAFCWNVMQQNNADRAEAGKTDAGDEIIPMLFPSDDGKTELCGGIWGFGIFNNGDETKIAAAKKFIDFICNDETQVKESVKTSGFFPVRASVTGVYDGTDTAAVMEMYNKNFIPSLGDYYNVVPGWATARTEWWNMLQRIGTGGDVQTEVETFVTNANAAAAEASK